MNADQTPNEEKAVTVAAPETVAAGSDSSPAPGSGATCCADWEPEIEKVNGPIVLQSIRAGKDLYTGKPFRFCPWCGQKRPNHVI